MCGIDEWLTGEDESAAVGVREGARGGGNGRAAGAAALCCRCLDARPHKPASLHRQLRLPRAADPALARLAAAWIRARSLAVTPAFSISNNSLFKITS